jgi:hypothetical protein
MFLVYLFARMVFARRLGLWLTEEGDADGDRIVTPLAYGIAAGLVGTLFANIFYLTMSFYYFFVFVTLLLALPIVYGRRFKAPAPKRLPLAVSPARAH